MKSKRIDFLAEAKLNNSIVEFQMPEPQADESRHYFEARSLTLNPNHNDFQFTLPAMNQMAVGYQAGLPLAVLHNKYTSLGIGQTSNAIIESDELFVQAYVKKNLQLNNGPFQTSNEYVTGILDGFIKSVSVSFFLNKASCSICGNDPRDWRSCSHSRGIEYIIGEGANKQIKRAVWIIEDVKPIELSLVQIGADSDASIVKKAVNLFYEGYIDQEKLDSIKTVYNDSSYDFDIDENIRILQNYEPNPKGDNSMSADPQEIIQLKADNENLKTENLSLKSESITANAELTRIRTELNTVKTECDDAKSQIADLQAQNLDANTQNNKLTTENETLTVKCETLENNKESLNQRLNANKENEDSLNTKISELETEIANNKVLIEDGRAARVNAEKEYIRQYVRYKGEDCSAEDKERQENHAKILPLTDLQSTAKSFEEAANAIYAPGRKVETKDENQNDDDDPNLKRPLGVSY